MLCVQAAWRVKALRRVKRFYDNPQDIQICKSCVLAYIEAGCVGFFHAAPSIVKPLRRIQSLFLRFLAISDEIGFLKYNLPHLSFERQISAFGFLHGCALKNAAGALFKFVCGQDLRQCIYRTRFEASKHKFIATFMAKFQMAVRCCFLQKRRRQSWIHVPCRPMSFMDICWFQQLFMCDL